MLNSNREIVLLNITDEEDLTLKYVLFECLNNNSNQNLEIVIMYSDRNIGIGIKIDSFV